jgi:hypothetical protein
MALEMKFNTNPRQLALLGVLLVVLVYVLYENVFSTPSYGPAPSAPKAAKLPALPSAEAPAPPAKKAAVQRRSQEFRPRVGPERPEDRPDPLSIDPTLRLDLLARLQNLKISGGMRSLFDFSVDPPPQQAATGPQRVASKTPPPPPPFIGPMEKPPDPPPPPPPAKPMAPPIPLKYYGYVSTPGSLNRKAFFLDGDDIIPAEVGETLKQRYKVIRINLTSVVMEDTQFQQQQTLQIVPEGNQGGD